MLSGFFCSLEWEKTSDNTQKQYKTLQLEGTLLTNKQEKTISKFVRWLQITKKNNEFAFFVQI